MIQKIEKDGKYSFTVKANNGQVIVFSQDYASESARDNGIVSLKAVIQREIFSEIKN